MDIENIGRILLVGDQDIHKRQNRPHGSPGENFRIGAGLPVPKFFTEIEITGNSETRLMRRACGVKNAVRCRFGKGWSDPGEMQPSGAGENLFPIVLGRRSQADSGICAVIDDVGGALIRTIFVEIQSQAPGFSAQNAGGINAQSGKCANTGVRHGMVRKCCNKAGIRTELSERRRHIRFRATKCKIQRTREGLTKTKNT